MRVRITFKERKTGNLDKEIKNLQSKNLELREFILDLGNRAEGRMKRIISGERKRPRSPHNDPNAKASRRSLIDSINLDVFDTGNRYGWGLGDEDLLRKDSPHWAVINWGGIIPPSTESYPSLKGHWQPATGTGLFRPGGGQPIFPKKEIKGLNYIERTGNLVRRAFTHLDRILRRP